MKRSGFGPRKAPMSRGSWARKSSPLPEQAPAKVMKRRVKKPTVAEGSKYLEACKNEPCYLNVPKVCWRLPLDMTVVPCHSNQSKHGKGMGLKAENKYTVPGCMLCHAWIDQSGAPREEKFAIWDRAYEAWKPVRARKMGIETELEEA